eukprot:CAMPEP_0204124432 /NCGR_PEP_ID=MMETSP0361-20130328/9840_1 /ASSEMBLY_ACC=CAM_ASM_000343 /TAXON_ID=268821 /ORGANISM="Scrippsiella Hangoei, Strain SHTV-5" /LENGTH=36 /DNA_ID= /DNA_START= /DNA_END= /DNA_ORIENTATION=
MSEHKVSIVELASANAEFGCTGSRVRNGRQAPVMTP